MELVNPLNLLKKGYVLTYQNDKLITKAEDVIIDDELVLNYYDGKIISLPKKKVKKEN
jgi:exonuclease VII large subunit